MPWVSGIRKTLRNGATTYEPSEAQAFGGEAERGDKEEQPQGTACGAERWEEELTCAWASASGPHRG